VALANLPAHPDSVPINRLVRVAGTPLADAVELDPFEFVRTIAVARILMPAAMVRLSAGREAMGEELQALCFLAGANSIFHGDKLLVPLAPTEEVTTNRHGEADLFRRELKDINGRETFVLGAFAVAVLLVGVWPAPLIELMDASLAALANHISAGKL